VGIGLIVVPHAVAFLIFGADVQGIGLVFARVGGIALLSLGVACGPELFHLRRPPALTAMFLCNAMLAVYLAILNVSTTYQGWLFWPALLLHGLLAILMGREWYRQPKGGRFPPRIRGY